MDERDRMIDEGQFAGGFWCTNCHTFEDTYEGPLEFFDDVAGVTRCSQCGCSRDLHEPCVVLRPA